ncbi:hypothetical protein [Nocardioides sp. LML1-1-1.1]|uniref:hypothetical protein n=1 Tax=Nocardioides sp. LML1-1-1.1 TaxID=3135248 RepID=UPI00343E452B
MLPRSSNRTRTSQPPLVGRLHELATTRPVSTAPASQMWGQPPRLAGQALIQSPQMAMLGQLGRGQSAVCVSKSWLRQDGSKTALMRWLYMDALRFSGRPVVVLDEAAAVEPFDFSTVNDVTLDPLALGSATSSSPNDGTEKW